MGLWGVLRLRVVGLGWGCGAEGVGLLHDYVLQRKLSMARCVKLLSNKMHFVGPGTSKNAPPKKPTPKRYRKP